VPLQRKRVIVIGAGIGGLTTAAILARAGLDVTVLEAHVYAGGCAGTFFHKGYRFDAGATLAGGFYAGGPMDLVAAAAGIPAWPCHHSHNHPGPVMVVHLPTGQQVSRWSDERRWAERAAHFGVASEAFWQWQEQTADALWDLALRNPPWPPQTARECAQLLKCGASWLARRPLQHLHPMLLMDAVRTIGHHLAKEPEALRQFADAQLLIAAQTTSRQANALYGASALDLPRRGVVHLAGGMGAIAETLVQAVRSHGGNVQFRQEVTGISPAMGTDAYAGTEKPSIVTTKRGEEYVADLIIANLPPWNIVRLLSNSAKNVQATNTVPRHLPRQLRGLPPFPTDGWGAFTLYVGVDANKIPARMALHHQIIIGEPMGEGNTLFCSFSPEWDDSRAPIGQRVITISTHTALERWWQLRDTDMQRYEEEKTRYTERLLGYASNIFPWLHESIRLIMPGTPITFQRFTRRHRGWVGGFPQTSLFRTWGPRLRPDLWMVGDSIFPGQSTAAVALGGMRVATSIPAELGISPVPNEQMSSEQDSGENDSNARLSGRMQL